MAKFCGSCGAQLADNAASCLQCGTPTSNVQPPPQQTPPQQPSSAAQGGYSPVNTQGYTPVGGQAQYAPVNPQGGPSFSAPPPSAPPPPVKKSNTGLKIVIGILAVLFVGALVVVGGLYYVGRKVVNKVKTAAAESGLSMPNSTSGSLAGSTATVAHGDLCSMLNKNDVGKAIGVTIVDTQSQSDGCSYMAKGTQADMTARHTSATMAANGADAQTQETIQKIAGGFFQGAQQEGHEQGAEESDTTPVLSFSIDTNDARTQMKLNKKVLGLMGPKGSTPLPGIGDEAFDSAGGIVFVRKGDKLARIMYQNCPCNLEAIKPLARKLADAM